MMDVSRRSFLGGTLVLTAAAAVPLSLAYAETPTLWGDGVHDDTVALQAMFDGEPVRMAETGEIIRSHGHVELSGGRYRVTSPLHVRSNTSIIGGRFEADFKNEGEATLMIASGTENVVLCNNHILGNSKGYGLHIEGRDYLDGLRPRAVC